MKTYEVKYEVNQEVYILSSKKIFKSRVEQIRVIQSRPWINGNDNMKEMTGIEIDYLVVVKETPYGINGSTRTDLDWFKQDDVYIDKEELLRTIV